MAELKDSGSRRDFGTGAVRDCAEGKGRCDLMPLDVAAAVLCDDAVLCQIDEYVRRGDTNRLLDAIRLFAEVHFDGQRATALMEASKQYEDGCKKYGDRNWEKGIPVHCYIDSGVRHYLKVVRGDDDEPHDRAFVWNMMGAIWTHWHKPELIDLPFAQKAETAKPDDCPISAPTVGDAVDMADLFKRVERMCNAQDGCTNCPLNIVWEFKGIEMCPLNDCDELVGRDPLLALQVVRDWEVQHGF